MDYVPSKNILNKNVSIMTHPAQSLNIMYVMVMIFAITAVTTIVLQTQSNQECFHCNELIKKDDNDNKLA